MGYPNRNRKKSREEAKRKRAIKRAERQGRRVVKPGEEVFGDKEHKAIEKAQKENDAWNKKEARKRESLKIKKKKKKKKDGPKHGKGVVAKKMGEALTKAGSRISKAQDSARTSVQAMRDKRISERNKKRKGYRL